MKSQYYYFGTGNITPIDSVIKFVDYLDRDLVYQKDTNTWKETNAAELYQTRKR